MINTKAIRLGLLLCLFMVESSQADAQYITIERISERVILAYWPGIDRRCNLTAIKSEKGLVIIDTEVSPRIMVPIKQKIEQAFGRQDWAYVINTHAHLNHAGGNSVFKGATVVGHHNLPEDMRWLVRKQVETDWKHKDLENANQLLRNLRQSLSQAAVNPAYTRMLQSEIKFWELYIKDLAEGYEIVEPTLKFTDRHTLDLGDLTLDLIFFGRGHSLSDTLVYVPQEKLLVTGAIVYQRGQLPEIGERTEMKDLERFRAVLDELLDPGMQINHVVPSHSQPLQKSDLLPVRDYYQRMLKGVRTFHQAGLTLEQATERFGVHVNFPAFRVPPPGHWAYGMHERNIRNLWRILDEEQQLSQPVKSDK
jgi:glyoxylase-like metal-dependent hydrolase (beta-lactamase superfamily II)